MPRILVIGSAAALTQSLCQALRKGSAVDGCETFTAAAPGLADYLTSPPASSGGAFDGAVYVAADRGPGELPDPGDAREALATCTAAGVSRLVVIASAAAYEPSHHHPGLADEERLPPLRSSRRAVRQRRDRGLPDLRPAAAWRALEEAVLGDPEAPAGAVRTVLRPPPVPLTGGRDPWSRLLTRRLAAAPLGLDPTVQLLAVEDLAAAVLCALEVGSPGVFNLAPAAPVPLSRALRLAGVRRLPVPSWCLRLGLRWYGGGAAERLDALRHPATVSGERAARELGFIARDSSAGAALALRRRGAPRLDRLVTLPAPPRPGPPPSSGGGEAGPPLSCRWGRAGEPVPGDWHLRFDDFGLDEAYIDRLQGSLFRFLHDHYWRIEMAGLENLPRLGRGVLVGVHRGFMPWDGVMALTAVRRATGRTPRFLIHPSLVKFPFLAPYMIKLGGIHACQENADRVLAGEGLVGMFPEGIRGAFSYYRDAYRLKRFGRDEFVRMALRNRAPLLPFVTVGSAEIFPILAKLRWRWWKRWSEWPCLPITPTFPLVPLPLPSKWHTRFLAPIHVQERYGPEAAEDPAVVSEISEGVRRRIEGELQEMLARRRSVFFGEIFPAAKAEERPEEQEIPA